eukprot:scaffold10144_cov88-Isochrysis_galbana.AAC.1
MMSPGHHSGCGTLEGDGGFVGSGDWLCGDGEVGRAADGAIGLGHELEGSMAGPSQVTAREILASRRTAPAQCGGARSTAGASDRALSVWRRVLPWYASEC